MDAGRWEIPEKPFRYLRAIADGDGGVARRFISRKERPEEGPADLSSEM